MSEPSQTLNSADQGDVILARILEEITQEVEAGQNRVDAAKYETQYPQYAQRIRDLVPAARRWANSGSRSSAVPVPAGNLPTLPLAFRARWATFASSGRSDGAGWGWCTKRSKYRLAALWP